MLWVIGAVVLAVAGLLAFFFRLMFLIVMFGAGESDE
jgi:hypothetical protein